MKTLGTLLASPARTEILRALVCQPDMVGLRQVARIAGVHPHSAELALAGMVKEDLVRRTRTPTRALYKLNRNHADVPVLEAVFLAAARAVTIERSRTLAERSMSILPFIGQANRMIANARRSRNGT